MNRSFLQAHGTRDILFDPSLSGKSISFSGTPEYNLAKAVLVKAIEDSDPVTKKFKFAKTSYHSGSSKEALEFILDGRAEFWCEIAGLEYKTLKLWAKLKRKELKKRGVYE